MDGEKWKHLKLLMSPFQGLRVDWMWGEGSDYAGVKSLEQSLGLEIVIWET